MSQRPPSVDEHGDEPPGIPLIRSDTAPISHGYYEYLSPPAIVLDEDTGKTEKGEGVKLTIGWRVKGTEASPVFKAQVFKGKEVEVHKRRVNKMLGVSVVNGVEGGMMIVFAYPPISCFETC